MGRSKWSQARRTAYGVMLVGAAAGLSWFGCNNGSTETHKQGHSEPTTSSTPSQPGAPAKTPTTGSPSATADGGVKITFGGPGPWPASNVTYGAANGILESPIVGTSTDETQNLWVATNAALYLLRPGQTTFVRFDAAAGLHLQSNPVRYCDNSFGDKACPIYGGAADPGISEIVGGGPNEVFVGYYGNEDGTQDDFDPNRHSGKLDRVWLKADGTLRVDRFDMVFSNSVQYWHNRSVWRMVFDHFIHPHDLYVGTNHGVDYIRPDHFRNPNPGEWFLNAVQEYMGDHLHPRVCFHTACTGNENLDDQRMGDWRGLALQKDGQLWVAGRWTGGLIAVDNNLDPNGTHTMLDWANRPGGIAYTYAFGDPYSAGGTAEGSMDQPVFRPAQEGEPVDMSAVSVAPNGLAWFASGPYYGNPNDIAFGVATWDGRQFTHYDPVNDLGMQEENVRDLIALPDGRILLAGPSTGLTIYNPANKSHVSLTAGQGIADNSVNRIELDTMVNPPAIHVSTYSGASVLRVLPSN